MSDATIAPTVAKARPASAPQGSDAARAKSPAKIHGPVAALAPRPSGIPADPPAKPRLTARLSTLLQPKLAVGAVDDPLEREADAIAEKVMRMPEPNLCVALASPRLDRNPAASEDEERQQVHAKLASPAWVDAGSGATRPATVRGGAPLSRELRSFFEPRFLHDFSHVRLHADGEAATAAREARARAYTFGGDIVFGAGQFEPATLAGKRLLAHELTHVVQQGRNAALARLGVAQRQEADAGANVAQLADEVIRWETYVDPVAGVGDFDKAFGVLTPLDTPTVIDVMVQLDARYKLELLYGFIGSAPESHRPRFTIAMMVVMARRGKLVGRGDGPGLFKSLSAPDQATIKSFASSIPRHWQTILFEGEAQEVDRLAGLQQQFLEDKRKAQEDAARKQAEADAKAKGAPPPASAPKVEIGQVLEKEVGSRAIKPIPTKEWDDLSEKDKNEVWPKRASAAFNAIQTSLKGTELENVMKGHNFVFDPRKILERGAYAYEDRGNLVCGMTFVKDAEADPKNVWPIVAHEIGGHAAYGETYAKKIMDKFLATLPEAEKKKWTQDKATAFFDAYQYAETEIFSALRQRRYDVPESGPAPVHGAIKPDDNIELRLTGIDQAFPNEVGRAILLELNERVKADGMILDRDKKLFVLKVKNHGYTL
jgi:Domain of unknown function (DUF4157)